MYELGFWLIKIVKTSFFHLFHTFYCFKFLFSFFSSPSPVHPLLLLSLSLFPVLSFSLSPILRSSSHSFYSLKILSSFLSSFFSLSLLSPFHRSSFLCSFTLSFHSLKFSLSLTLTSSVHPHLLHSPSHSFYYLKILSSFHSPPPTIHPLHLSPSTFSVLSFSPLSSLLFIHLLLLLLPSPTFYYLKFLSSFFSLPSSVHTLLLLSVSHTLNCLKFSPSFFLPLPLFIISFFHPLTVFTFLRFSPPPSSSFILSSFYSLSSLSFLFLSSFYTLKYVSPFSFPIPSFSVDNHITPLPQAIFPSKVFGIEPILRRSLKDTVSRAESIQSALKL